MVSSELYHIKQQFIIGAYTPLLTSPLPDVNSPDYPLAQLYQARAHIALSDPSSALSLISSSENIAAKATRSLAKYISATSPSAADESEAEAALEELRDSVVEIEGGEEDGEGEVTDSDKALVKVLAGTAFARAGEVEEALETLGTDTEDLEAVAVLVQIYLSINRPDLAKKQFDRSKSWAEDDLLLQLIESTIHLVTGTKDNYGNPLSFFNEQLGNPSLSGTAKLLTARAVTRLLRGEVKEAASDLEESLNLNKEDEETQAAWAVATGLGAAKKGDAEDIWSLFQTEHPNHPLVLDVKKKSDLFDEALTRFTVPPAAVSA